jgi:hypothetical protein
VTNSPNANDKTIAVRDAERLFARAAELDAARDNRATIAELRAAAAEAGISTTGFDEALAELHGRGQKDSATSNRSRKAIPRWARYAIAMLVTSGFWVAMRSQSTMAPSSQAAAATIEEAFVLRCLSPGNAAELVRPMIADESSQVVASPARAPRVLTVRASPAKMQQVRELLARFDGPSGPCATVPSGSRPGSAR